jgi:PIN domain
MTTRPSAPASLEPVCRYHRLVARFAPRHGVQGSLIERFAAPGFIQPDGEDPIEAAQVCRLRRRHGVQVGTIDAVLILLCRKHDLVLLSSDKHFRSAAKHVKFRLWSAQ